MGWQGKSGRDGRGMEWRDGMHKQDGKLAKDWVKEWMGQNV